MRAATSVLRLDCPGPETPPNDLGKEDASLSEPTSNWKNDFGKSATSKGSSSSNAGPLEW